MDNLEFIHITKTAGTSIEDWGYKNSILWGYKNKSYFQKFTHKNLANNVSKWHVPPLFFHENPYMNKKTFTCVRNPYTRMISEYYCPWSGSKNAYKQDKDEFNVWIVNLVRKTDKVSGIPQYLYMPVDYIIHFETLQKDFTDMIHTFDLSLDTILPHVNKSKSTHTKFSVKDLYPQTIKIINEKYKKDFEIFGYDQL
jgi:hypothetical protein